MSVVESFPVTIAGKPATPSNLQKHVVEAIDKHIKNGVRYIIVESPVGTGKSAMAITLANAYRDNHIITPRKSLQDQYIADFGEEGYAVLMKGRNAYPCAYEYSPGQYKALSDRIKAGHPFSFEIDDVSCGDGPCKDSAAIYKECKAIRICPYKIAMETAADHQTVIHNIHSFMFQTKYTDTFTKRFLFLIDEAHDLEDTLREFVSTIVKLPRLLEENEALMLENAVDNCNAQDVIRVIGGYQNYPEPQEMYPYQGSLPDEENYEITHDGLYYFHIHDKNLTKVTASKNVRYHDKVSKVIALLQKEGNIVFLETETIPGTVQQRSILRFVPTDMKYHFENIIGEYGDHIVFMSGTIYDKVQFCKGLGIDPEQAVIIKAQSPFRVEDRPIIMKDQYMVDTSHKCWDENFSKMIDIIIDIASKFDDVRGLIHTPSYFATEQIMDELQRRGQTRFYSHRAENFLTRLDWFMNESPADGIFLSPVCQQGVDFKADRARFNVILRVPYPNVSDPFTQYMMNKSFKWYNHKTLIAFGQQTGRVNRFYGDFGVTILVDERFKRFMKTNKNILPKWLMDAVKE